MFKKLPPETSIRKRLILYIGSGLLLAWFAANAVSLAMALHELNESADSQMSDLAQSLPYIEPEKAVLLPKVKKAWAKATPVLQKTNKTAFPSGMQTAGCCSQTKGVKKFHSAKFPASPTSGSLGRKKAYASSITTTGKPDRQSPSPNLGVTALKFCGTLFGRTLPPRCLFCC